MVERDDFKTLRNVYKMEFGARSLGSEVQVDYQGWADNYKRQLRITSCGKGSRRWSVARPWHGIVGGRGWNMAYDYLGHVEVPEGKSKLTWPEFVRQLKGHEHFCHLHQPERYFTLVTSALWWAFKMVEKEA